MDAERGWRIAARVALVIVGVLLVVLTVTGILLTNRYRPSLQAFADVRSLERPLPILSLRRIHRLAAVLMVPAVVCLAVATIGVFVARRKWALGILPIVGGALTVGAIVTGYLLPWDQLALRSVTVGTNMKGYGEILHGDRVKYVLVGEHEISHSTFVHTYWIHSVLLPVGLVAVLLAIAFLARRRRLEQPTGGEVGAGAEGPQLLPDE